MKARDYGVALALAGLAVASAATAARWRHSRTGAPLDPVIPSPGLIVALSAGDLVPSLRSLAGRPLWGELLAEAAPAFDRLPPHGPAGLGIYERGWIAAIPPTTENESSARRAAWRIVASTPALIEKGASGVVLELVPGVTVVQLQFGPLLGRIRRSGSVAAVVSGLPSEARGRVAARDGTWSETWRLKRRQPSVLDLLANEAERGAPTEAWSVLPDRPAAVTWARIDPDKLRDSFPDAGLTELERFLDLPLRNELASVLAGTAAVALLEDPRRGDPPRAMLAADLSAPARARAALDRILAIGVLAGTLEVGPYRGANLGAWRAPTSHGLEPAIAIDGDLLLVATHASDLRNAIDRRRRAVTRNEPPPALARLSPGSFKASSRSPFVLASWREILTRRPATLSEAVTETRAVIRVDGDRGWIVEGDGPAPCVAADPVVPLVRSLARMRGGRDRTASERPETDQRGVSAARSSTRATYARVSR